MKALLFVVGPLALAVVLIASPVRADPVQYDVSFTATWSSGTHPSAYPAGAHFSPLVGGTHNDLVSFWNVGALATPGIERMAESGATSTLLTEVQTAISAGTARNQILGSGIGSPGNTATSFEVSSSHSRVTLVTMIAPSPDWFVGVSGLDLRDGSGWRPDVVVDLFAYDAGTDSGVNFISSNFDTNPKQFISLLGAPLAGSPPLGSFRFTLVSIPEPSSWALAVLGAAVGMIGWRRSRLLKLR